MVKLEATSQNIKEGMESTVQSTLVPELRVGLEECFDLSRSSEGRVLVYNCALLAISRLYEQYLLGVIPYFPKHEKGRQYSLTTKQQLDPGLAATTQGRNSCHRELEVLM